MNFEKFAVQDWVSFIFMIIVILSFSIFGIIHWVECMIKQGVKKEFGTLTKSDLKLALIVLQDALSPSGAEVTDDFLMKRHGISTGDANELKQKLGHRAL